MITQVLHCPYGQGTDRVRHGTSADGKQRSRCRECRRGRGCTFLLDSTSRGQSPAVKQQIVDMAMNAQSDIEQPLTERNLINLAHILPKQAQDVELRLVETFNEVVQLTLDAHPHPMNPFEQLADPA